MKKAITFLMFLISALMVHAQSIGPSEVAALARNFFNERNAIHSPVKNSEAIVMNQHEIYSEGRLVMVAVNFTGGGYVLVSASRFSFPVLGYSMSGEYTGMNEPESFHAWIRYFSRQLAYANQSGVAAPEMIAAREKWSGSADAGMIRQKSRVVEPLLRTTWDQGNYYNAQCPADPSGPGGHCWAGCVATAVGQLMFYHRWPNRGTGSYSYTHPVYGEQNANFGETTYNWNGMEPSLSGPNNNIALLLNHLGISFDMDYGPDGSGMWNHSAASSMRAFFKYGPQTQYIFRDSTTMNWDSILVANLDNRKPLYYAGWEGVGSPNGHAFVCDGYAPDNFYHFNWGWSNAYDGYFLLSALSPGGNNFNFAQEVIKDIYPDTLSYNYPEFCAGPDTIGTIAGTFSDGSNSENYLNNSDCFWLIQPNEPDFDSISSISLNFPLLDLTGSDRIRIYQGADTTATLIADITGTNSPPTLNIPSSAILARFTSDDTDNAGGFLASFKSILPVYCSGITTFTDSAGTLDDGSGAKKYNNSSLCKWKITPANLLPVTITFDSFNTEADNDFLRIYDLGTQQLIATYSGDTVPDPLTIESGKAYLVFMTNKEVTAAGWSIHWATEGTIGIPATASLAANIYPNPVSNQLWINPGNHSDKKAEIRIYGSGGALIRQQKIRFSESTNKTMISTASLKSGFYILTITSESGVSSFRFTKL